MDSDKIEILDIKYEVPKPIKKKTLFENIQLYLEVFCDVIQVIILYTIYLIKTIFTRPVRKNIGGKLALVTGGANGLGKQIALRLAKEGCNIAIVDLDYEEGKKTAQELQKQNVEAKAYNVDVSDFEAMFALRKIIISDLGVVDILVNNAAILPTNLSLREGKWTSLERILKVNIHSHFWVSKALHIF